MSSFRDPIFLRCFDDKVLMVEKAVAFKSQTIKSILDHYRSKTVIELPRFTSTIMRKVIDYCKRHVESEAKAAMGNCYEAVYADLKEFDAEFVNVEREILYKIILAAHYLKIESLLHFTRQAVIDTMKGTTAEEKLQELNNSMNAGFTLEQADLIRSVITQGIGMIPRP